MLQTKTSKNKFKNIHDLYMNHRYEIIMSHLKNKYFCKSSLQIFCITNFMIRTNGLVFCLAKN